MTKYMVAASRLTGGGSESSILQAALEEQVDPETVRRGGALAATKCVGCHRFYQPRELPADAWPGIVESMGERSLLTYDEMLAIASYYVQESQRELQVDLDD